MGGREPYVKPLIMAQPTPLDKRHSADLEKVRQAERGLRVLASRL